MIQKDLNHEQMTVLLILNYFIETLGMILINDILVGRSSLQLTRKSH